MDNRTDMGLDMEIDRIKERLLAHRREIEEDEAISLESRTAVELDQTKVGRLSRMDALQGQAMALETERRRLQEIARIDAALKRIEDGDYGYCIACGDEIAAKRLEFDPATPVCVACAAKAEHSHW